MASSQMLIDSIAKVFGHISELIRFVSMFMICDKKVAKICNSKGTQVIAVRFGVHVQNENVQQLWPLASGGYGQLPLYRQVSKEVGK